MKGTNIKRIIKENGFNDSYFYYDIIRAYLGIAFMWFYLLGGTYWLGEILNIR